jgi:hypothetical protein
MRYDLGADGTPLSAREQFASGTCAGPEAIDVGVEKRRIEVGDIERVEIRPDSKAIG